MKEIVIEELKRLGYSDISAEEIIKNAYPMQFLSSLYLFRFLKFFSFDGTVVAKNILVQND